MAKIYRSDLKVGNLSFVEHDPDVLYLRDHVYCPSGTAGCVPGVYDFGRKLIGSSTYSRGPMPAEILPSCSLPFAYESVEEYGEAETYIYLGEVFRHFGHFLLSTLSRLWLQDIVATPHKIIVNAGAASSIYLDRFSRLFNAFGVDVHRFCSPQRPVKLRNLILPCASFEERNFVHSSFGNAFRMAGDKICNGLEFEIPGDGPIYLSKSKMVAGVRKIINEQIIEDRLRNEGFTILYPETLPVAEQVAMWRLGRTIVAFNGSGLHTSVFSTGVRMVSLGWDRFLDSSFMLCDMACHNRAEYFYFEPGTFKDHGPSPDHHHGTVGISSLLEALDPIGVAEGILRAVGASKTIDRANLALGRSTSQSSTYVESDCICPKFGAASGRLSGRYQFCTENEEFPWWQVDLGGECAIDEMIFYNRTDSAPERASRIRVMASLDGKRFDLVATRESGEPFGGLNGEPWRLTLGPPRHARFVRLSIPGPEFLHLDQVEVFGRRTEVAPG